MRLAKLKSVVIGVGLVAALAGPALAQSTLRDVPKIFGRYAPGGDCSAVPRVIVSAGAVRIEGGGKRKVFKSPELTVQPGTAADSTVTVTVRGSGKVLILSFAADQLTTSGDEPPDAAGRTILAAGAPSGLAHCRPPRMAAAATPAETPPPAPEAAPPAGAAPELAAATSVAMPVGSDSGLDKLVQMNVMSDAGFKAAYLKALGSLRSEDWLIDMDGPGEQHLETLAGVRYLEVTTCKDHDCGDNAMMVLYRPQPPTLYGFASRARHKTTLGKPPAALMPELKRLWKIAWPAG